MTETEIQYATISMEKIDTKIAKYRNAKALLNTPDSDEFYNDRIAILEDARSVFCD